MLQNFVYPLPDYFLGLPSQAEGSLLGGKVRVSPFFAGALELVDEGLVVGLHYFFDHEVSELGVVGFQEVHDVVELGFGLGVSVATHAIDDPGARSWYESFELQVFVLADL